MAPASSPTPAPPPAPEATPDAPAPSVLRFILLMGAFTLAGLPFVAYLWQTINLILNLEVTFGRLLISLPVAAVFLGLLALLNLSIRRWLAAGP